RRDAVATALADRRRRTAAQHDRRADAAGASKPRAAARRGRSRADQSRLYAHRRAGRRRGRAASGARRSIRFRGHASDRSRRAAERLGRRELSRDADDEHASRPARDDRDRRVPVAHAQGPCAELVARVGRALLVAAARQRDRKFHQGRATDSGQDRARLGVERCAARAAASRNVGRHERRYGQQSMSAFTALGPLARSLQIPPALRTLSERPWIGIIAVMLSAIAATLTSRLTSFGLADIGGALGVGVDQRAWITTAFSAAQMFIGPISPWLSYLFG